MKEEWKPVIGFEGYYEVSSLGRVRSLDRTDRLGRFHAGRILSQCDNGNGYLIVNLKVDGQQKMRTVHSLVAEAFIGPVPAGKEVCHGPNGQQDNSVSNLSYGTRKLNHSHKKRDGTHLQGEAVHNAVLSEEQVLEIVARCNSGEKQQDVAADLVVHKATVNAIMRGKSWAHLTGIKRQRNSATGSDASWTRRHAACTA